MKTLSKNLLLLLLAVVFVKCSEDEGAIIEPQPTDATVVNFKVEEQLILKSVEQENVIVTLDQAAPASGSISIRLSGSADYQKDFITIPAAQNDVLQIAFSKGATNVSFSIIPLSEENQSGNQSIVLNLENPATGFALGNKISSTVTLVEEEVLNATVSFRSPSAEIGEDGVAGIEVEMLVSGNVDHTEIFFIDIEATEGFTYLADYITEPALTIDGQLKLEVYPDMSELTFKVIPVNDVSLNDDFEILFTIAQVSDGLSKGMQDQFNIVVTEDDIINPDDLHTIAELRAKFEEHEGDWYLPHDYFIEGVVSSDLNVIDDKTIYIQDETGGIMLMYTLPRKVVIGDKLQINLKNSEGDIVNEQKTMTGVSDLLGIKLGHYFTVAPEVITLEQLATGEYKGKRVRIENVSFVNADGNLKLLGSHQITDGERVGMVSVLELADFADVVMPQGKINIGGIVGEWNRIQPQSYFEDFF